MGWANATKNATVRVRRVLTYDRNGDPLTWGDPADVFIRLESDFRRARGLGLETARGDVLNADDREWDADDRVWLPGDTYGTSPENGRRLLMIGKSGTAGYFTYWAIL